MGYAVVYKTVSFNSVTSPNWIEPNIKNRLNSSQINVHNDQPYRNTNECDKRVNILTSFFNI